MALPKNVQNQLKMTPKQLKSTQNGSKSAKNAQNRVGSSKFSRTLVNVHLGIEQVCRTLTTTILE